jgi:hypothetical protein
MRGELTYMLTPGEIINLIAEGKLRPVRSRAPGEKEPRVVLLRKPMQIELDNGLASIDEDAIDRWEALQADMAHFVEEGLVTWKFMKWLDPKKHEIWELISKRPRPSLRVFGRFAMPNVYIATHVAQRNLLGGKWSLEFEIEKLKAEEIWNDLTEQPPFVADTYEEYITSNARRTLKVENE